MAPRRKLHPRYARILTPLAISVLMTLVVSGVATAANLGFGRDFLMAWPKAWGLSWLAAFPTLLFVLPLVRRLVAWLVEMPGHHG